MSHHSRRATVSVNKDFYARLEAYAKDRGVSISSIVEQIVATLPPATVIWVEEELYNRIRARAARLNRTPSDLVEHVLRPVLYPEAR